MAKRLNNWNSQDILKKIENKDSFALTINSYKHQDVFNFTCVLGDELCLKDYQVGLYNFVLPKIIVPGDEFILETSGTTLSVPHERDWHKITISFEQTANTKNDILGKLRDAIRITRPANGHFIYLEQNDKDQWAIRFKQSTHFRMNDNMKTLLCSDKNEKRLRSSIVLNKECQNNDFIRKIAPIGYLSCSLVNNEKEKSERESLLAKIPLKSFCTSNMYDVRYYEPSYIDYKDIKQSTTSRIQFKLQFVNGNSIKALYYKKEHGCVITLHFKPKNKNCVRPREEATSPRTSAQTSPPPRERERDSQTPKTAPPPKEGERGKRERKKGKKKGLYASLESSIGQFETSGLYAGIPNQRDVVMPNSDNDNNLLYEGLIFD